MIAKLIVHDTDRERARRRMLRALSDFVIEGPPTLLGFHRALLQEPCFVAGGTCSGIVESEELAQKAEQMTQAFSHETTMVTGGPDGRLRDRAVTVELDGRRYTARVRVPEPPWGELARRRRTRGRGPGAARSGAIESPMQGTVLKVEVVEGAEVAAGQVICVVEAMKMENEIAAPADGVVRELSVAPGDQIASGQLICIVDGG
jgi:acetyl-CoA/propionyl-CoA carboxylase biotin carboxyl carrier protein